MSFSVTAQEVVQKACGNRRATVRYRCAPATFGKLLAADEQRLERAWIVNISKTGIGLTISRPMSSGAFLGIQLRASDGLRVFELTARVVHATPLPQSDWLIGCELIDPLCDDDLDAIL